MSDAIPSNASIDVATRLNRLGRFARLLEITPHLSVRINTGNHLREPLDDLYQLCYQDGWVLTGFNWPSWSEGRLLIQDRSKLSKASADDLARLLTLLIRQDRFCEGTWEEAYDSGLLFAITHRAKEIASAMDSKR